MSYSALPDDVVARIGGFVGEDLPSYGRFLLSSKRAGEAMSTHAMTSTVRGRTIHLFKRARKRATEQDAPTIRVDLSRLLHTLLGPSHTQRELGEKQTDEEATQERDIYRFISSTRAHTFTEFLATYDYLEYDILFRYLLFPRFEIDIGHDMRKSYRIAYPFRHGVQMNDIPITDEVLNYAVRRAIQIRSPSAVRHVLVKEFNDCIVSADVLRLLMDCPVVAVQKAFL
eukprot:4237983-Pleurochrysis_carterae.AAC.1